VLLYCLNPRPWPIQAALAFLGEFATALEQRLEETALYPLERRLAVHLLKNPDFYKERFEGYLLL
jgi:hypothetical protein